MRASKVAAFRSLRYHPSALPSAVAADAAGGVLTHLLRN
jgi:hypothetical protein